MRQEEPERAASELRPPASLVAHVRRRIGREEQLHHLWAAVAGCLEQRSIASAPARRQHWEGRLGEKFHRGQGPFNPCESIFSFT